MGRPPRILPEGCHFHVIVRCNNEEFHFENDEDFELYLDVLRRVKRRHEFKLFNYELMNSHVHLFLEPASTVSLSKTMMQINWNYAFLYNQLNERKGHFWLDRFCSIPVDSDLQALLLMRYINRNPIRAGMTQAPGEWKWSGYRFYAEGETNKLLDPHPSYLALGINEELRRKEYENFVQAAPKPETKNPAYSDPRY